MPNFCLSLLLAYGHKVTTPLSPKCKHCIRKSKKQPDPNYAGITSLGLVSIGFAALDPLSADFAKFAGLAAANVPSKNLIRNYIKFCDLG